VLVLDRRESRVAEVRDEVQRALIGDARSLDTLKSAITQSVDEVALCLGENMEASVLCALHLSQIGVPRILSTATNEDHATILRAVGAHDVIFPDIETAERTARRIAHPNLLDYFPLSEEYRIMEIVMPEWLVGKTLAESELRATYQLLVLAIRSGTTDEHHFMPAATDMLHAGDKLVLLGREVDLARFTAT
jgi:trk system potassium uptake protein TrkA